MMMPDRSERGITIVYYGDGKGKTTAALGTVLRAAGQGWRCSIVQFIKGSWPSSERTSIPKHLGDLVTIEALGKGFVGIMDDRLPREDHKKAAKEAQKHVLTLAQDKKLNLLVLDEILDVVDLGFFSEDDILHIMDTRKPDLHLIMTGHSPYSRIFESADLVTEMRKVKHPYDTGRVAIRGLDF